MDLSQKIQEIAEHYKNDVQVLSIYVRETHAKDGWEIPHNTTVCYMQPKTLEARAAIARDYIANQKLSLELWLDQMDNSAALLFNAEPERLYICEGGKIAFVGGVGPFNYDPWQAESWLKTRLGY